MPKHAHHTFAGGGIAIWHITETPDELYALLGTDRYDEQLRHMTHEARRAEWLAVRLLADQFFGPCEVAYHPTGRPYLKDSTIHISISHTRGYAAIAYHHDAPIGMDVEYTSSRVEHIASRFTSEGEAAYIAAFDAPTRQLCHLINWSAKETLYKLYDAPSMAQFKEAFHIAPYCPAPCGTLHASVPRATPSEVEVHYHVTPDYVCTWGTWNK